MYQIVIFIHFTCVILTSGFNCKLPIGCEINNVHLQLIYLGYEKTSMKTQGLLCDIRDEEFEFNYSMPSPLLNPNDWCNIEEFFKNTIEIRFHSDLILSKKFNFKCMLDYTWFFSSLICLNFVDLKGFQLVTISDLDQNNISYMSHHGIENFNCIRCKIEFYSNSNRLVKKCQDIIDSYSNNVTIRSLFQVQRTLLKGLTMVLVDSQFKTPLCPLVFMNSDIEEIQLIGLADTFYKKNILTIEDRTFDDLNSKIQTVGFQKVENINIDSNQLNPSVFRHLQGVMFSGSVNMIDGKSLNKLKNLTQIAFLKGHFRDMIHKNGIKWMRELNADLDVNLSSLNDIRANYFKHSKWILIGCFSYMPEIRLSKVFPDEDFCLYKDFPFNQLVILMQLAYDEDLLPILNSTSHYSCTYLWLAQHFHKFIQFNESSDIMRIKYDFVTISNENYKFVLTSKEYQTMSTCKFKYRLSLCDKSTYETKNWWGKVDYIILNKKLQSAFKIAQYLAALSGIATNLLVIIIILHKKNKEVFKDLNHYSYLWLNSLFYLLILLIWVLSWISECFYPFEVFCPEIRKVVFIQYFKIVFKEVIVTTLKFMCNFTYVAFALNRIALIGKDHSKFIKFISEVDIKAYTTVCFLISLSLSWIKYFKYQVNYFEPNLNYPISNEWDLLNLAINDNQQNIFNNLTNYIIPNLLYFIYNSISDLINYVIFVIVCIIIDVFMVVKVKRTLDDKLKWYEKETNSVKYDAKKKENEDAVNKLIKMVILNSALGVLFKLPSSFLSIVGLYATFYYKDYNNIYKAPLFGEFYSYLLETGFYSLIIDCYEFLFIVSIAILLFIYKRFDKKFLEGYNGLLLSKKIKNSNNNKSNK